MPETIEAEVIEIDGKPLPPAGAGEAPDGAAEASYGERFKGTVLNLDRRWWPLWLVLGVLILALMLTVGLVVGVVFLVVRLVARILALLFGGFNVPPPSDGAVRRG